MRSDKVPLGNQVCRDFGEFVQPGYRNYPHWIGAADDIKFLQGFCAGFQIQNLLGHDEVTGQEENLKGQMVFSL